MVLVCYLRLCSQRYIIVHVELVDFLSHAVATTRTTTTLAYNTQQITMFLAIQPVWCRVWHPENLLHPFTLRFTAAIGSGFCAIVSYACTCLDHALRTTWAGFRESPHAIKSCLPCIYPWRHARDKMYQALPLLSRESLGTRLILVHV